VIKRYLLGLNFTYQKHLRPQKRFLNRLAEINLVYTRILFFLSCPLFNIAEQVLVKLDYHNEGNIGGISFTCNIQGLPMTSATWDSSCASIWDHNTVEHVDMLQNPLPSSYMMELIMQNVDLNSFKDCTLTCDVYSNWALANQSKLGRQRKWESTCTLSQLATFFSLHSK
jgi:hypothetical protein